MIQDDMWRITASTKEYAGCQLVKVLGRGYEGIVFLVADSDTATRYVVKLFYTPKPKKIAFAGLQAYAVTIDGTFPGLTNIRLLETDTHILGVSYTHHPLYLVHYRLLRSVEQAAKAMVGAYCRMQSHLISTTGVALIDAYATNFLMDHMGQYHWVDFGYAVQKLDDPFALEHGLYGYGMATLLLSLFFVNIQPRVMHSAGYSEEDPCRYCLDPRLDGLAKQHAWLRDILDEVCCQPAAAFHDPEFYSRLGARLPDRVASPQALLLANWLLHAAGPLWLGLKQTARYASVRVSTLRPRKN